MFRKYRILEINNVFIPQIKKAIFDNWYGIDGDITWITINSQIVYAGKKNLEAAKEVIDNYIKNHIKTKEPKQIIHKYNK